MQQRDINTSMDSEIEEEGGGGCNKTTASHHQRGRHNSKLKVLVRSHAMREETSPPREPTTPNSSSSIISPAIKLTPSPEVSPVPPQQQSILSNNPLVVLSPSVSTKNSPTRSPFCISPTSTLVPSSPQCSSPHRQSLEDSNESPKYNNNNNNSDNTSSHNNNNNKKKFINNCDCSNDVSTCTKCIKNLDNNNHTNIINNNNLSVTRVNSRGKLRQQSSSQGSFEGSSSNSPCLSRDSSSEQYTDTTGVDLDIFIPETLNRNAKDRSLMLRIEQELVSLAKDSVKTHFKFPPMSSYQRMLVHRCAAYFGMDHNIEASGKCVIVNKTKCTRIPDVEFKEHVKEDIVFSDEQPRRSILKRDSNSIEDYSFKSPDRQYSLENRRSKSFEEREEEYEKARRRIFNREMLGSEEFGWSEVPWSSSESENFTRFRLQPPPDHNNRKSGGGKLTKVHSEDVGETLRPCVAKSYSFGGYGGVSVLNRGDSVMSTHSAGPRLITKQDSAASSVSWRLSPSSSGYKSQSQLSESVTPSPTSTPHPPGGEETSNKEDNQIMWAVTDIESVPKGCVIINPKTGKPIKNQDGTVYHYDPDCPPEILPSSPKKPVKDALTSPIKKPPLMRTKSTITNSSTSPILPYSPPLGMAVSKSIPLISGSGDGMPNTTGYPLYGQTYPPPPPPVPDGLQMYQPPCIVYTTTPQAPYPVTVPQYDNRVIETAPCSDLQAGYYINVPENTVPTQMQTYQQQSPYWTGQPTYYQNLQASPSPAQRFPVALTPPNPQTGFATYPQLNYMAAQQSQNSELVYPNQTVPVMYQGNQMVYPQNQIVYAPPQNPAVIYGNPPLYPAANSSTTTNFHHTELQDHHLHHHHHQQQQQQQQAAFIHNMAQLNLAAQSSPQPTTQNYLRQKSVIPKGNKFSKPKSFLMSSSHSSGTNSPAAVITGYCPQSMTGLYRHSTETPPLNQYGYAAAAANATNYVAPVGPTMVFRQMSNVRANTPGTNRSSRSPTPASDITLYERQRMPTTIYQGMPYVLQSDTRLISGRNQQATYRSSNPLPPIQQQFQQTLHHQQSVVSNLPPVDSSSNNRSHSNNNSKGRKSRYYY